MRINHIKKITAMSALILLLVILTPNYKWIFLALTIQKNTSDINSENKKYLQQPATSNQQPATSNQQPATSNQQPATSNQQPATSNDNLIDQINNNIKLILISELGHHTGIPNLKKSNWHKEFTRIRLNSPPISVSIKRDDNGNLTPVSLTKIASNFWLFTNYRNIYVFNPLKRTAYPIRLNKKVPIWSPTAVYYSPFYDRVFIANYTGKDIIVAKITPHDNTISLELDERITHLEALKGPEGVHISQGGRYMAVADYDGGAVSLFERVDGHWVYRWKQNVQSCHGVSIVGDYVYASGTTIAKFALTNGQEIKRITTIGERPILFTTCINYDEKSNGLIGSDTMAGRVFSLSRNLELINEFGSNGPSYANLSMPYCAYQDKESLIVLSTYQERIFELSDTGKSLSYEFNPHGWGYLNKPIYSTKEMWHGTQKIDHPSIIMFGQTFQPNYGSLIATNGTTLYLPSRSGAFSPGWLYYIITTAESGDWIAISSNSTPRVLLYQKSTGALGWSETGEWDCWAMASDILCPHHRYSIENLVKTAHMASPENNIDSIAHSLHIQTPVLLDELSSSYGQLLRVSIEKKEPLGLALSAYFKSTQGQAVPLVEYWLATQLSNHNQV